jgi:hypothetical protein
LDGAFARKAKARGLVSLADFHCEHPDYESPGGGEENLSVAAARDRAICGLAKLISFVGQSVFSY